MTTVPAAIPGPLARWVVGARPRTLAAAAVPVTVGTAVGWWLRSGAHAGGQTVAGPGVVIWWRAALALVVAMAIQVGTNYANDYSDGVRGTDTRDRIGPLRLVASGAAAPASVRSAALACFGVAGVAGLVLAAATTWWLVPVGAACVGAGWLYTGGPRPYGYLGLGEAFVFVFFGVVATVGTAYVQAVSFGLWWACIPVGLLSTALLEANNLRDVAGDAVSGKRTLAVRVGAGRARWLYVGALAGVAAGVAGVAVTRPWALLALLPLGLAVRPARAVLDGAEGRGLLPVLGRTGQLQLCVGALLAVGILL
ncbi:MAG TPA: 1,4-dihydroxy-2-naphthoate polyprenyltransferase [Acidimicrobiales bacterium]|nr:1,4-dihydroxy-2-naphthoate polyprenyltransferase [Acidimicrobiales bacterium]